MTNPQTKLLERTKEAKETCLDMKQETIADEDFADLFIDLIAEIQRLDRCMETIGSASHIGDGSTAIYHYGEFYSCQRYARDNRYPK